MPKPAPGANPELTPIELIALSTAVSSTKVDKLKNELPDNSQLHVDFTVRIQGPVSKGASTPDGVTKVRPTISLTGLSAVCAALRNLGIGPVRLRKALEDLPPLDQLQVDAELSGVFDAVGAALCTKLPDVEKEVRGKRGAVTSSLTATKVI